MNKKDGAVSVRGFKGINNRLDPTALGLEWQLQAENALCDDAKYLVRRPGYAAFLSSISDMYGTVDGRLLAITSSGALYEVYPDGSYRQRATGCFGWPFQWAEQGYAIFAMSETAAWAIYPDRVVPWGIPVLSAPSVSAVSGSLAKGTYQLAVALVAADGRIGGSTDVATIALDGQGVTVSSAPVAGYSTRLYVSRPDGSDLYLAGTLSAGSLTVSSQPTDGARLETSNIYPPPLGGLIAAHGNRMLVAIWEPQFERCVLYWSKADAPHWFDLEADYQIVSGRPTLLASVQGGVLIGTDRALYATDAAGMSQRIASYGAVPGTMTVRDDGKIVFWSDHGLTTYPPLELPTDEALSPDNRSLATGAILDYMGSSYYVTAQRGQIRPKPQTPPYIPLSAT